jgi:aminopeptidase N
MKLPYSLTIFVFLFVKLTYSQGVDSDAIWNEGIEFMQNGDYLQGLERMNSYLKEYPYNKSALHNRSICLKYLGDIDGSCNDINTIYKLEKNHKLRIKNVFCNEESKVKWLKKQYYKNTKIYPELGYRPRYTLSDTLRGALRPERNCYDVTFYDLTVRIFPFSKKIRGSNEIYFRGIEKSKTIQVDLFENFTVDEISLWNKPLKYKRVCQALFIELPDSIVPDKNYKLTIKYSGKPMRAADPPWDGGFVWKRDRRMNRWVGVACEQLGASSWWPNKDHLSDKPDSMAINIEVPEKYNAISNRRLRKIIPVDHKYTRYEWFVDYPVNNYNATFYMGKYTEFTDTLVYPDSNLIMRYHVLPYHFDLAKHHFEQAKSIVRFYNKAFGPFPFWKDNYRLVESPYEGMEHQTAIAYGEAFSNEESALAYVNKKFDYIIVHESAHEWWGNAIAAGDMADIWIHEGFATYAEILYIEDTLGYNASIEEMQNHLQFIYNVWPLVQNRDVNENTFASNDVYTKGAALLLCLRATMNNDSMFKQMIYDFNMEYRFKIVNSDDFIQFVNNYTNANYTPLIDKFLYDKRIPVLSYTYTRVGKDLYLRYKWTEVEDGFTMPFSIETINDMEPVRLVATTEEQQVVLKNTVSFNFFHLIKPIQDCPHNGLTYFWTHCRN